MITLKGDTTTDIVNLYYRNNLKVNPSMHDILELMSFITLDFENIEHVRYRTFWDFFDEVANNIETGKWRMHPYMWKTYIMNASYTPMSASDVEKRHDALRNKCINMLRESNLPIGKLSNRQLLLRWSRNPNGFQDILSTVKTMVELNKLFSKKEGI